MRWTILSILSLGIVLVSAARADDVDVQQAKSVTESSPLVAGSELLPQDFDRRSEERFGLMRPWTEPDGLNSDATAPSLCYKIRRYLVERDDPKSDSTHIAGYSKCQRASKYSLKKVAPLPEQ